MDDRVAGGSWGIWLTGDTRSVLERPERLPREADGAADAVIRVQVLGRPAILSVPEDQHVRASSVEFLTYLIARGGSAGQDEIVADLMPELPRRTAAQRMHTYTYNLRQIFARLGGGSDHLRLHRHRYVLDRAGFDVDLWTMLDAVADAGAAPDSQARLLALRRALDFAPARCTCGCAIIRTSYAGSTSTQ
ncbi:hypothetical protein HH310_27075 [Actinoplanes sp. TBRC 11911]|uniref:hypothetical protein n=1 Tax=Actinoplanes sp. TBRC 11911 TaxID=2729386 RepID=UPI00145FB6FE|nr:hypothetical protein [Actinoplanes sp. TBRC 11911]NMO54834.1 hypothetical protein [Actinoplanes sp. TBRC 11911]